MFFATILLLLLSVYIAPALALFPRLILSSRDIAAIPFVSVGILGVIYLVLNNIDIYTPLSVRLVAIILFILASIRIRRLLLTPRETKWSWPRAHRYLIGFCFLLSFYWAIQLGSSGFDTNDEIYSWNMWAIQHYLGERIDYHYTASPYPQLFAILISYCYQLLGNYDMQMPVKALFALFPLAMIVAIAVSPKQANTANALTSLFLIIILSATLGKFFRQGLADPLMASALTVSIYFYFRFNAHQQQLYMLVLSIICAAVAVWSKQAALIWAIFSFPLIALHQLASKQTKVINRSALIVAAIVLLLISLAWLLGVGSGFQQNTGVIAAAQQERGTWAQIQYAIQLRLIDDPVILLIIIAAISAFIYSKENANSLFLFFFPALFAWLFYGTYSLRLGIHVLGFAILVLAIKAKHFPIAQRLKSTTGLTTHLQHRANWYLMVAAALIFSLSITRGYKNLHEYGPNFSFSDSGYNSLQKFFSADAEYVYKTIYKQENILLWVPSNYLYGLFYGHTPVIRPDLQPTQGHEVSMVFNDIIQSKPDYVFDAGTKVAYGNGSKLLRSLADEHCPQLFNKVAGPNNRFGYILYHVLDSKTNWQQCQSTLNQLPRSK